MRKTLAMTLALSLGAGVAQALTISGPLNSVQIAGLTAAPNTHYGAPAGAVFPDGPLVLPSGSTTDLLAGPLPGQQGIQSLLVVLSIAPGSWDGLGTISLNLSGAGTVSFGGGNFYSTGALGFPALITSIGNGAVNDIKFPTALHAAAKVGGLGLGGLATGSDLGDVTITSPVDLRVDLFGIADTVMTKVRGKTVITPVCSYIANNTPNSHALGVTTVPDGGSTLVLAGIALLGLGIVQRKWA